MTLFGRLQKFIVHVVMNNGIFEWCITNYLVCVILSTSSFKGIHYFIKIYKLNCIYIFYIEQLLMTLQIEHICLRQGGMSSAVRSIDSRLCIYVYCPVNVLL